MAKVSIKYKQKKSKLKGFETIYSKKIDTLIVIDEENKILKFKSRVIHKICMELNLNIEKLINVEINSIEIEKDLGSTNYDI